MGLQVFFVVRLISEFSSVDVAKYDPNQLLRIFVFEFLSGVCVLEQCLCPSFQTNFVVVLRLMGL